MKPTLDRFAVVTASLDPDRANACLASWRSRAAFSWPLIISWNGYTTGTPIDPEIDAAYNAEDGRVIILGEPEILGVVPAFARGVQKALSLGAEIIACLHDDLLIEEDGWDQTVIRWFDLNPRCGLAGFGGGTGLGHADIYRSAYYPQQLAREGFVSNMRDAQAHGRRATSPVQVACLDGFSQIGRRQYWLGEGLNRPLTSAASIVTTVSDHNPYHPNLFRHMESWGLVHHAYDAALGAFAKRLGWDAWMIPIACHHFGGRTAVGDPRYATWAEEVVPGGDRTFWELAHKEVYERFRDVLPIRI